MNVVQHFPQSYVEARDKFSAAARKRGARTFCHVHPSARGAAGEELSMDFAMLGDESASGLLVMLSATHGVEGFCGSGCQVALLHDDAFAAAVDRSGIAVLMLHALNPYGFSHLRRVNEDNADLNRNFTDFAAPLPVNEAYAELHDLLLPPAWPAEVGNEARLGVWIARHGPSAFQAAVSAGQYRFPRGMFFGGAKPAWSNVVLRRVLRETAATRTVLGWIDFHTGLGPRGRGEKIYAGMDSAAAIARTKAWWGDDVTSIYDGTSTSARLTGINGAAAFEECPHASFAGIALEYGTYPIVQMLQVLRADHWLENHPEAGDAQRQEIKRKMRDMFYIDADDWKTMVYDQALDAAVAAVKHIALTTADA